MGAFATALGVRERGLPVVFMISNPARRISISISTVTTASLTGGRVS